MPPNTLQTISKPIFRHNISTILARHQYRSLTGRFCFIHTFRHQIESKTPPRSQKIATLAPKTSLTNSSSTIATQRSQAIARHFSSSKPSESANMANLYTYNKTPSEYTPRTVGQPYTLEYRCYIEKNGQPVSPFHDIPLYANEQQTILNMIVEIPRWSNAKQEV